MSSPRQHPLIGIVALVGLAACHGPPPLGGGSAPITIDGNLADWDSPAVEVLLREPAGDGKDKNSQPHAIAKTADLLSVSSAQDADKIYFLLEFAGPLPDSGKANYAIYIDADSNTTTGYLYGGGVMGVDFMIINGSFYPYAAGAGTTWSWGDSSLSVQQAAGPIGSSKLELSIARSAMHVGSGSSRAQNVKLSFAGIDDNNTPNDWTDDITDYLPDLPSTLPYRFRDLPVIAPPPPAPKKDVLNIKNYLIYYGEWDRTIVPQVNEYNLLVLSPGSGPTPAEQGPIVNQIRAGKNGRLGDEDDVIVLGYISLGEDLRSFNNAPAAVGDGRGPAYWDKPSGALVYENLGVASYYLDEKIGKDTATTRAPWGQDGLSDRHGTWGACYVNTGDLEWQNYITGSAGRTDYPYSSDVIIDFMSYDGLFMDTPEVADPWNGYGYTAKGMHDLVQLLRDRYPRKVLLLNRGLFFLMPQYPFQYQWSPRTIVDIGLYESHYLDSNYPDGTDAYHVSPFYTLSRNYSNPKVQAEFGRPDSFCPVVNIDYAADPDGLPVAHPDVYNEAIQSSIVDYGRIELITDRLVQAKPRLILDAQLPIDRDAPKWDNSTGGYSTVDPSLPFYMAKGSEDWGPKSPRVGLQKAVPGEGQVTLRWDVANDQSRRVKYNVYYSTTSPIDFAKAIRLLDVKTAVSADYTDRSFLSSDDSCPYEYTVAGLKTDTTYYFAVRAEDSSTPVSNLNSGHVGPSGGIEDDNTKELPAAPRIFRADLRIAIDGAFDDWKTVPVYANLPSPMAGPIHYGSARITDDDTNLYLYYQCAAPISPGSANYLIFLNTDQKSYTGHLPNKGADYLIQGSVLFKYSGDGNSWTWSSLGPIGAAYTGTEAEIRISKAAINPDHSSGLNLLFSGDNGNGMIDHLPEDSVLSYRYLR